MNIVNTMLSGIEKDVEQTMWGGLIGLAVGYMFLPLVAGIAATALSWSLGGMLASLIGGGVMLTTAVIAHPINRHLATLGGLIGGAIGLSKAVDEPEKERGQTIQLDPDQEIMVISKGSTPEVPIEASPASVTAQISDSAIEAEQSRKRKPDEEKATTEDKPTARVQTNQANYLGNRVTELVYQYAK